MLVLSLTLLFSGLSEAQAPAIPVHSRLANVPLQFVEPTEPDWLAIEKANAPRTAQYNAENTLEAAQQAQQAQAAQLAAEQVASAPAAPTQVTDDNWYKTWIYNEESGNNPARWNTSGCLGLGQACPASKLIRAFCALPDINQCPIPTYTQQDAWFTNYMLSRYGSWQAAYEFHIANGWW